MSLEIVKFVNCIIFAFVDIFLLLSMARKEDLVELTVKRWIVIIATSITLIIIANYLVPLSFKVIAVITMMFVLCCLMYKTSFWQHMLRAIAVLSICGLTETILSLIFVYSFHYDMAQMMENVYYYILYNFTNFLLIVIIAILFKIKITKLLLKGNISKRTQFLLSTIIILQFLRICVEFFIWYYIATIPNLLFISVISYICSIFSIGLLLYSTSIIIDKENIIEVSNEYNEKLNVYNEVLQNSMENQRKIAHEHGNQLAVLSGYIANANLEKAAKYLEKIIGIHNADNEYLCCIKESGLKALLVFKTAMIERKNIELEMVIDDICDTIIPSEDLCKIMGVFLDNATEAASQSDEPYICLTILKNEDNLVISIMNSIKDTIIDTNKIFKKGYSSKGEGRGFGLHIVDEIVKKYEELELHTKVEDELFIQELHVTSKAISLTKN